eukprot:366241-Chlamydomonas_euryale.AAC.2
MLSAVRPTSQGDEPYVLKTEYGEGPNVLATGPQEGRLPCVGQKPDIKRSLRRWKRRPREGRQRFCECSRSLLKASSITQSWRLCPVPMAAAPWAHGGCVLCPVPTAAVPCAHGGCAMCPVPMAAVPCAHGGCALGR